MPQGNQEESNREHIGESKPQGQDTDVQQDDPEKRELEKTLRAQIAKMRQKADLLEQHTGDIRTGLDSLLNLVERKNVELAHVEGTIRTLRSQMDDATTKISNEGTKWAVGSEDAAGPNHVGLQHRSAASPGSSTTTRVHSETSTPGVRRRGTPNPKEMRGTSELQLEAEGPHVVKAMVSSQRRCPGDGAAKGVPTPRVQNGGEQPQKNSRRRQVVRGRSAPTGTRTLCLTPRPASPRIVAGERRPVPVLLAATARQGDGHHARSPSPAFFEWMRSRAPDAQESPRPAQSHPCSSGCTPSRQRLTATWSTPCVSCASPVGVQVASWPAPSLLAPQQPQAAVQSPGRRCRDALPQWPLSVRGPVVAPPLAAWIDQSGASMPFSSVPAPCSGCAGLRPPPGLACCLLTLPPAWL